MTKEQRKSLLGYLEIEQSILNMIESPNCDVSMQKKLEAKLQKYRDKIKELVCSWS